MRRYLLVEVRVGTKDETPHVGDWGCYKRVRDRIGAIATDNPTIGGNAEVGQVLELTTDGIKTRYGPLDVEVDELPSQNPNQENCY
jgi:hypothetical protein